MDEAGFLNGNRFTRVDSEGIPGVIRLVTSITANMETAPVDKKQRMLTSILRNGKELYPGEAVRFHMNLVELKGYMSGSAYSRIWVKFMIFHTEMTMTMKQIKERINQWFGDPASEMDWNDNKLNIIFNKNYMISPYEGEMIDDACSNIESEKQMIAMGYDPSPIGDRNLPLNPGRELYFYMSWENVDISQDKKEWDIRLTFDVNGFTSAVPG